jgi:hypothetical protein
MDIKGLKIGFLGDSISEGTGASSYEKSFVGLFAAAHPEARVFNHSIGATKIAAQIVPLADKDNYPFFTRVEEMDTDLDVVLSSAAPTISVTATFRWAKRASLSADILFTARCFL